MRRWSKRLSQGRAPNVRGAKCEDDRCWQYPGLEVWHCIDCDSNYCSDCWARQGPHKPTKRGRDGVPHEKSNPMLVQLFSAILDPPHGLLESYRLHGLDKPNKWLALGQHDDGLCLEEYARFSKILHVSDEPVSGRPPQPQLVSFVGVTNAGKSTIVKLLVQSGIRRSGDRDEGDFASPVAGSASNDTQPTSGDVHLYADPVSYGTTLPMLFADCEGFEGGDHPPLGASARDLGDTATDVDPPEPSCVRDISWTASDRPRGREGVVTSLFPRILYTFSSCVVFVLRNPKTFQSAVLTRLLDWGAAALERSINQPCLPHCVVVLNASDPRIDESEWSVDTATRTVLTSLDLADDGVPARHLELKEHWSQLGYNVQTTKDLLLRYYASFAVVRVPSKPSYERMSRQVWKLRRLMQANCKEAAAARHEAGLNMSAKGFRKYLSCGLDHFARHQVEPFDFMQAAYARRAVPITFRDNVLQLCVAVSGAMREQTSVNESTVIRAMENLCPVLASCILLDQRRAQRTGTQREPQDYVPLLRKAMETFYRERCPCWYRTPDGKRSCKLVRSRHSAKGHQDDSGIFAAGDFMSDVESTWPERWASQILNAAAERTIRHELDIRRAQGLKEREAVIDLHLDRLNSFYEAVCPASEVISHATCLCCNLEAAEHALPCGHVLCSACIHEVGERAGRDILMRYCPMHRESTRWREATVVRFPPRGVAPRVLVLEDGGVRSIMQLEVLCMLEEQLERLGGRLSVRACFDLVVGAGAGGLVAVMASRAAPSLRECCEFFQMMCGALPRHQRSWTRLLRGQKARDGNWHDLLRNAFHTDQTLFPQFQHRADFVARAVLVCSDSVQRENVVLANYRRREDPKPLYRFERPQTPRDEFKLWESAAVTLSSRVIHLRGSSYVGEVLDQDLMLLAERECNLTFPGTAGPALLLSIGPGLDSSKAAQAERHEWHRRCAEERTNGRGPTAARQPQQYVRVNPTLNCRLPPQHRFDQFDQFYQQMQNCIGEGARGSQGMEKRTLTVLLRHVAYKLVASNFYLAFDRIREGPTSGPILEGHIVCRFDEDSQERQALGRIVAERRNEFFKPYFIVHSGRDTGQTLTERVDFCDRIYRLEPLPFSVCLGSLSDEVKCRLLLELDDKLAPEGHLVCASDWKQQVVRDQVLQKQRGGAGSASNVVGLQGAHAGASASPVELPATEMVQPIDEAEELIKFVSSLLQGTARKI